MRNIVYFRVTRFGRVAMKANNDSAAFDELREFQKANPDVKVEYVIKEERSVLFQS